MGKPPAASPLTPPASFEPDRPLPELEEEVLTRWREREVFRRSLAMRKGKPPWVFYEGPPTANGPPGAHHVLSRVFKDIYPRFQTMRGRYVERKGGWDCHGLPVELSVEQELGIKSKAEIEERVGIETFNARCREAVLRYVEEWNRLTERIGFWVDLEDAYHTLDEPYIESVWWALAQLHRKGLLYEAYKVLPYCFRCQTALSSHELALGYEEVEDEAVYLALPLALAHPLTREVEGSAATFRPGDRLLVWTTTPWTLPANVAVAVHPDHTYVRARRRGAGEGALIVAASRLEAVLGSEAEVSDRFSGRLLLAGEPLTYEPLGFLGEEGRRPLIAGPFISAEEGTGLVHIAPAHGAEDFEAAVAAGLVDANDPTTLPNPVGLDGRFSTAVRSLRSGQSYGGRLVKEQALEGELIADLQAAGLLVKRERYRHAYPHCWRCESPLIYLAKSSWYVRTSGCREALLGANETVNWFPPHVKQGRFGEWLKGNVDWALSRDRYWGTPLPVWRCAHDKSHFKVIASFRELEELSGSALADHHRPYVDRITFPCPEPGCAGRMTRVSEVIDVWFDSGAMPFAQFHYPFAGEQPFGQRFPADFVCEAIDQTRGWFYSLLAIATLLFGRAPYRNVVCLGLILDAEGQKMSKSRGNAVDPWAVINRYGADAFRWYLFTAKAPWDGYRFSEDAIAEEVRLFLRPLYNTLHFYTLYAHANRTALHKAPAKGEPTNELDRWILSRAGATAELVGARLDHFDATAAGRALAQLLDELSNWYVRRSRRRFWDGEVAAFQTLRRVLLLFAQMLAPFCPFAADFLYTHLEPAGLSVHLCDFPSGEALPPQDPGLEAEMEAARRAVRLGLAARAQAKIKLRQPLCEAVVLAEGADRQAVERLAALVQEELNVKRLRVVGAEEEVGSYTVKPNYRTLGPRFGAAMPKVAAAVGRLAPRGAVEALRRDGFLELELEGGKARLAPEDLLISVSPPEGFVVEREGGNAVALDLTIDQDLKREGLVRELVRAVQNARRNAGLEVVDRIELALSGAPELLEAAAAHADYLKGETLSTALTLDGEGAPYDHRERLVLEGLELRLALRKAP